MVAQALRLHTTSVTAGVQASILRLLSALVLVRVNFCLLDQEQRFIAYLYKQLEQVCARTCDMYVRVQIEEGHYRGAPTLAAGIFTLITQLTYERGADGRAIVDAPVVLQHADSLLASCLPFDTTGASPTVTRGYRIPTVYPVLHAIGVDLFVTRPPLAVDALLHMQQEVFAASLVKCLQWPQVRVTVGAGLL